jgi:hypothetical protein
MAADESTENPDDLVEIHDAEIDVEEIMRRIRADAQRLRRKVGDPSNWPSYGMAAPGASADEDLYEHLRRALATHDKLYVEMILTRRNRLSQFAPWAALRRALHGLVIFYVNTLAGKQTLFNTQVIHTLNRLAEGQEARAAKTDVAELRETVRLLEQRLAELEHERSQTRQRDRR